MTLDGVRCCVYRGGILMLGHNILIMLRGVCLVAISWWLLFSLDLRYNLRVRLGVSISSILGWVKHVFEVFPVRLATIIPWYSFTHGCMRDLMDFDCACYPLLSCWQRGQCIRNNRMLMLMMHQIYFTLANSRYHVEGFPFFSLVNSSQILRHVRLSIVNLLLGGLIVRVMKK